MNKVSINIPETLYKRIKKVADELGVRDFNAFIIDLLRDAIGRMESELSSEEYTLEELEKIRERLRSLGYLD